MTAPTLVDEAPESPADTDEPRVVAAVRTPGDRRYRRIAYATGAATLVIMAFIAFYLLRESTDAFNTMGLRFFTTTEWQPDAEPAKMGVLGLLYGTVVVAIIALAVAVPLAVTTGLFINDYVPRRAKRFLTSLVDLLAAIPSLIFGMWGLFYLQPQLFGSQKWMAQYLDFIPFLRAEQTVFAGSLFMCGLVVALMILPIITAVVREVFAQAPPFEREGALALGATRWGMIRTVVLPFGRGGIIGGSMLGLGRALGETIAVAIILSPSFRIQTNILDPGGATVASTIALEFPEASPLGLSGLMAAGLTLFVVTLVINLLANVVVGRSRSGAGVEI